MEEIKVYVVVVLLLLHPFNYQFINTNLNLIPMLQLFCPPWDIFDSGVVTYLPIQSKHGCDKEVHP